MGFKNFLHTQAAATSNFHTSRVKIHSNNKYKGHLSKNLKEKNLNNTRICKPFEMYKDFLKERSLEY